MHVVVVNDFAYVDGGASQIALKTAKKLAERGIQVSLFTAVGPVDKELINVTNLDVICLKHFDILNNPNRLQAIITGLYNFKAARAFENLLSKLDNKKTIIHIHSYSKSLSTSVIRIANKLNFKILFHMHDYGLTCPNLGFYNYNEQKICKLKPLSINCLINNCDSRAFSHKVWRCLRQIIQIQIGGLPKKIKYFIAVSNFSYKILKSHLPKNNRVFILNNPIDIQKQTPVQVNNNQNFIFIGRLSKEKAPSLLAKAASELNVPAIFVGEGECAEEITKIYPEAKITGWLKNKEVEAYISKARALVFTPKWYETQGLVVLEAAAKGVPALVASTCAAQDFIIENKTGLLFESGNIQDLKRKIIMLQNDHFVRDMGLAAYERFWSAPPTLDNYINKLRDLYINILEED